MVVKHKIYAMSVASVYPHYVRKAEKAGGSVAQLEDIICWLTGYDRAGLHRHIEAEVTFEDFFHQAPRLNPSRLLITGSICGVRIEEIGDPLMREIRYLDKLVDELSKGRPMTKILGRQAGEGGL